MRSPATRFSGWEWITSEVCEMGSAMAEDHYISGGVYLDDVDPTIIRVSVEQNVRNFQIQAWSTDDDGDSWTHGRDLSPSDATATDPTKRGRAKSVRNHGGDLVAAYFAGSYIDFEDYDADVAFVYGDGDWDEWGA